VSFHDVTCAYDGEAVLDSVNLQIDQGELVGIVGPSGAGKTTLLRAILGVAPRVAGEIAVGGRSPIHARRSVGYVPQLESVDWSFPITVRQVVATGLATDRSWFPWLARSERQAIDHLLSRLGIAALADRHIRDLSGGQQQRAFLARALIRQPALLLLDEPTSGVDVRTRQDILGLLDDLNRQGITIILTTHDLNAVASCLPRVICLNRRVVAHGAPVSVFTPGVLAATFGGDFRIVEQDGERFVVDGAAGRLLGTERAA
jgi:zinc/manganese transport system ATP-binding protein/zinc transport system ATP-binding protein